MMLYGEKLKVALLTIHKPIIEVSKNITFDHFIETVKIINSEMIDKFKIKNPSIGVLGLNPHAGENGKLGKEEIDIYIPAIKKLLSRLALGAAICLDFSNVKLPLNFLHVFGDCCRHLYCLPWLKANPSDLLVEINKNALPLPSDFHG
jgi:4-hydroxy-L-threonine phosphate dehydrogenase PdxA